MDVLKKTGEVDFSGSSSTFKYWRYSADLFAEAGHSGISAASLEIGFSVSSTTQADAEDRLRSEIKEK